MVYLEIINCSFLLLFVLVHKDLNYLQVIIIESFYRFRKRIIKNLIYIAQFDTNGVLTALYIIIQYIQMRYVHI